MFFRSACLSLFLWCLGGAALGGIGYDISVHPTRSDQQVVSLCCFPDGGGKPFNQAGVMGSDSTTDATLHIQLYYEGELITDFPAEDIWLDSTGSDLVSCQGGTICDQKTDDEGRTFWADPLLAGGQCNPDAGDLLVIIVNGDIPLDGQVTNFFLNSPDINGDLAVDLADVGLFSTDYYSLVYNFRSDFKCDGDINLSDVGLLAAAHGSHCP